MTTRREFVALAAAVCLPCLAFPALAEPKVFAAAGLAIQGYDAVAYFLEQAPVLGSEDHTFDWNGATWRFASEANRAAFAADPEAYAPQYGGYCAFAMSKGKVASTTPDAWTVHEGKLYLNVSLRARDNWSTDIPGNISKANMNWPAALGQ